MIDHYHTSSELDLFLGHLRKIGLPVIAANLVLTMRNGENIAISGGNKNLPHGQLNLLSLVSLIQLLKKSPELRAVRSELEFIEARARLIAHRSHGKGIH